MSVEYALLDIFLWIQSVTGAKLNHTDNYISTLQEVMHIDERFRLQLRFSTLVMTIVELFKYSLLLCCTHNVFFLFGLEIHIKFKSYTIKLISLQKGVNLN